LVGASLVGWGYRCGGAWVFDKEEVTRSSGFGGC
jgi:hypothetical protein